MRCLNCDSESIETGILCGEEKSGPRYYVTENGRASVHRAVLYCDLCLKCGTLIRTYIKEDTEKNWVHDAVPIRSTKYFSSDLSEEKRKTLDYYNQRQESFTADTRDIEFTEIQDYFLRYLKPGSLILDLGCGTGRDSRYFLKKGYRVEAADGSDEMVKIATETAGIPVRKMLFEELDEKEKYDGIFACASLLHVRYNDLPDIMNRISRALKDDGILYVSFKYGTFEGYRSGRYFTDLNEERFLELLSKCRDLELVDLKITNDARPGRENEIWLNAILKKD